MASKKLLTHIFLKNGKAVTDLKNRKLFLGGDAVKLAKNYEENGADGLILFDLSKKDEEHELNLKRIREISRAVHIPLYGGGHIERAEDVKKLIYAGCNRVFLNMSKEGNISLLEEVAKRFGREKIAVCINEFRTLQDLDHYIDRHASLALLFGDSRHLYEAVNRLGVPSVPFLSQIDYDRLEALLRLEQVFGVSGAVISDLETDLEALKETMAARGINFNAFACDYQWSDFKPNAEGLLPVIVQDYDNRQVLMLAYMNEEAFRQTLITGKMTYYSRSRQKLWVKGETSGHYQYVRRLSLDCDNDTLLAGVIQVGAACHTGHRSCFYRDLVQAMSVNRSRAAVFEEVMEVILERKAHPKDGSYTNYLFDKGLDKILKKMGEEATEIVIAAKNPDPEEIKYEIGDFLYHLMVLMAEKGITWADIAEELSKR